MYGVMFFYEWMFVLFNILGYNIVSMSSNVIKEKIIYRILFNFFNLLLVNYIFWWIILPIDVARAIEIILWIIYLIIISNLLSVIVLSWIER